MVMQGKSGIISVQFQTRVCAKWGSEAKTCANQANIARQNSKLKFSFALFLIVLNPRTGSVLYIFPESGCTPVRYAVNKLITVKFTV